MLADESQNREWASGLDSYMLDQDEQKEGPTSRWLPDIIKDLNM